MVTGTRTFSIEETLLEPPVINPPPTQQDWTNLGKLPDFSLHIEIHLTVNANGEPTATVVRQRIECGGEPLPA